jgi:hypothetical protein
MNDLQWFAFVIPPLSIAAAAGIAAWFLRR